MNRRRIRSPRSRWTGLFGLLAILAAVVALPTVVIGVVRYFQADGERAQLVAIERNFYGTDDSYSVDYVELHADDRCILGVHSSGVEYLLVFENDERTELRGNEVTVGPVLYWPQHASRELVPTSPGEIGYARTGDVVAIDSGFDPDQVWEWKTRPHEECERDEIALVAPR